MCMRGWENTLIILASSSNKGVVVTRDYDRNLPRLQILMVVN